MFGHQSAAFEFFVAQVEQQQQVVTRKQEQASAARQVLQQLKATPEPDQQILQLIVQQNQALYLARVLQVGCPWV